MLTQVKAPFAAMDVKHFGGVVAMLRIGASGRLSRTPDIEAVRFCDVDMLDWVLGNAWTNNREVLFPI